MPFARSVTFLALEAAETESAAVSRIAVGSIRQAKLFLGTLKKTNNAQTHTRPPPDNALTAELGDFAVGT